MLVLSSLIRVVLMFEAPPFVINPAGTAAAECCPPPAPLGRAVRNEYLALGTIISTAAIAFAATSGGSKDKAAKPASSLQESIQQAKASVPINAKST